MDSIEKAFDDEPDEGFLQVGNPFSIDSTSFKKAPARSFASAAFKANEKGWKCTIELKREPTNKKNEYAVKVFGIAEAKLFGISNIKTWHIGYLPDKISWGIACDVPPARQINAQLNQVDRSSKGEVLVTMTLLVGPIITAD